MNQNNYKSTKMDNFPDEQTFDPAILILNSGI